MLPRFCYILCLGALLLASPARAGIITITDVEPMIDFPDCNCGKTLPELLPFALFDFTGQMPLATITGIEITLTMQDGDTALGELDYGNLTLQLDNVNTGIQLNDFPAGQEVERTFTLTNSDPNWLSAQDVENLILALNDNQLFASIHDATPDDNKVNLYSVFDTTISITGEMLGGANQTPEPSSALLWGMAAAAAFGMIRKRRRA